MAKGIKTGGRKPGTPNVKRNELRERLEQLDKDPFDVMLECMLSPKIELRFMAAKELLQYQFPKRKAVEMSGNTNASITFEKLDGTAERYTLGPGKNNDDDNTNED